jgi:pimeloyl-ACP methyl ester carboxylesterase
VAIYRSRSAQPAPDPVIWLVGGPGGRAHALSTTLYQRVVEPYLAKRDFIVMDVRGTGYSEPALNCPDTSGRAAEWIANCRKRLGEGADLSLYNSAAVAGDLADLRQALGLREWNLMGESYGTRIALTAMRDRPEGIRSVVLDSVAPPEADEYADGPSKFEGAITELAADCAADRRCNAAYPDLQAALQRAADALDRSPRRLAGVWHGSPYEFRLDGRQLMEGVHMALYESDLIPQIPKAIYEAADGRADAFWSEVIARHTIFISRGLVDQGAHFSYHCAEEIPFTDRARLVAEDGKRPWMRHVASGLGIVDACRLWDVKRLGSRETQPVKGDIPVLLVEGEYDPVTPPAYARSAASHLRNSHLIVFPGMGHWVTATEVSTCPQSVVLEFLDNPARASASPCLKTMKPRWELP